MFENIQASPVSTFLLAVTLLSSFRAFQDPGMMKSWMLNPYSFFNYKRYQTVFTSGFIHAVGQHLLFNMITFFFFAFPLEEDMTLVYGVYGHLIFLFIYLASMVLADISSLVKHRHNPLYNSLGASGAIAGIMFSFILFEPLSKFNLMFLPIPGGIPSPIFALLYMVYSYYSGRKNNDNIGHEAHLFGGLAGLGLTFIFFPGIFPYFIEQLPHIFD